MVLRLVVRCGASGNCTYDEAAKRELIEICLTGGHSVAGVALARGINANQLLKWRRELLRPKAPAT